MKWIAIILFSCSGLLVGITTYLVNMEEIGWGSSESFAPVAAVLSVGMYFWIIAMVTQAQKQKGKLITSSISFVFTALVLAFFLR